MTAFDAFRTYLAVRTHFTKESYDIFKYRGRVSATMEKFETRNDRFRIAALAKKYKDEEIVHIFVANFINSARYEGVWDDQTEVRYRRWKGYQQGLEHNFRSEVRALFTLTKESNLCYNDVFFSNDSQHPPILYEYLAKNISLETFIILDRINNFTTSLVDDFLTGDIKLKAKKYSPFLKIDIEKYESIIIAERTDIFG